MARMTGGEAIVDSLLRHGIDTVFGLPGRADLRPVRRLRARVQFAAPDQRAPRADHRLHGAGLCVRDRPSHSAYAVVPGPGVLNTSAALATAWGVNAPVLCLTGQVPSMMIGRGRGQLHELPGPACHLAQPAQMGGTHRALPSQASHPSPRAPSKRCCPPPRPRRAGNALGPVHIKPPPRSPCRSRSPLHPKPQLDPERIAALAKLLDEAKAPMLWVGGGASTPQRKSAPWPRTSTPPSSHFAAAEASSTTSARSA